MLAIKLFYFIWGLPQNIIGVLMYLYFVRFKSAQVIKYKDAYIVRVNKGRGAMSLGQFIFLFSRYENEKRVIKHEYGHTRQSHILGPLYLLIIGLPSITWALGFRNYREKTGVSYYNFYTEKWADKLGGLK